MPASGRVVLDTSIAIAFLSGDRTVRQHILQSESVFVPTVVIGELLYGAQRSQRVTENLLRVDNLIQNSEVREITLETARNYGIIKSALRHAGTPIPDNDIWIAALAMQHDAAVATRDDHFAAIAHLMIERW